MLNFANISEAQSFLITLFHSLNIKDKVQFSRCLINVIFMVLFVRHVLALILLQISCQANMENCS